MVPARYISRKKTTETMMTLLYVSLKSFNAATRPTEREDEQIVAAAAAEEPEEELQEEIGGIVETLGVADMMLENGVQNLRTTLLWGQGDVQIPKSRPVPLAISGVVLTPSSTMCTSLFRSHPRVLSVNLAILDGFESEKFQD